MITKMRRGFLATTALLAIPAFAPAKTASQAERVRYRVVFQVSDVDPQKWNLTLNNVQNLMDDLGKAAVFAEIVVYGPGIGMLKGDSAVGNRVADALKGGVQVVACENTMQGQKLARSDMLPGIGYVKSGVVELVKKQREGFAYIRP